jgi:ABC-type oligopeptide transport system substrate-binding subunit
MSYFSLNGAYGAENLKNTPSQWQDIQFPPLPNFSSQDSLPANSPVFPPAAWNTSYEDMQAAYQFPVPVYSSPYIIGNIAVNRS